MHVDRQKHQDFLDRKAKERAEFFRTQQITPLAMGSKQAALFAAKGHAARNAKRKTVSLPVLKCLSVDND